MSIVRINAISVPEGQGDMLLERFKARAGAVDDRPGFMGFELLRPTGENEDRWFVITHWEDVESFDSWVASQDFAKGHGGDSGQKPVASGSAILEFDVEIFTFPFRSTNERKMSSVLSRPTRLQP